MRLSLKREALAELTNDELGSVNGATADLSHVTCTVTQCQVNPPTRNAPCVTLPIDECAIRPTATLTC